MARDIKLAIVTTSDSRGLRDTANLLDRTSDSADDFNLSMQQVGKTSQDIDRKLIDTRRQVAMLGDEFVRTGDRTLLAQIRTARRQRDELERVKRELREVATDGAEVGGQAGTQFMRGLTQSLGRSAVAPAVITAVGVTVAPFLAQVVAAAVAGGVGLGGIAGGIAAASRDPAVRSAASRLGDTFQQEFFGEAGAAFVNPTVNALRTLERAVEQMDLAAMLAPAAAMVERLAAGVAGFGIEFGEGFGEALKAAGPTIDALNRALPTFGESLGDAVETLASSESAAKGLEQGLWLLGAAVEATATMIDLMGTAAQIATPFMITLLDAIRDGDGPKQMVALGDGARNAAEGVAQLTDSLIGAQSMELAAERAGIRHKESLDNLTASLKENGLTFDDNTEKGRTNHNLLLDSIAAAMQERDATIAAGRAKGEEAAATQAANRAYQDHIVNLRNTLMQLGLTRAAVDALIASYNGIPRSITTYIYGVRVTSGTTNLTAGQKAALSKQEGRAGGGSVYAGQIYRVNETGQEFFQPAMDGRVIPTAPVGSQAKGNAGTGDMNVTVFAQFGSQTVRAQSQRVTRDQYWRDKRGYY